MSNEQTNFTDPALSLENASPTLDVVSINKSELFTKEQCEQILADCVDELWIPATVVGNTNFHKSQRQKLRGKIQGFPFLDIREVTKNANDSIFDFSLLGIIDQDYPQVFKYGENDFYNMHMELNPMALSRKITFIINLSDPSEYEGGNITFLNVDANPTELNEQGTCLVFPSYIPFSIDKVTKGNRKMIVGHVHGAVFK